MVFTIADLDAAHKAMRKAITLLDAIPRDSVESGAIYCAIRGAIQSLRLGLSLSEGDDATAGRVD